MKLKHLSLVVMTTAIFGPLVLSARADAIRDWNLLTVNTANAVPDLTSQLAIAGLASAPPPGPGALAIWGASLGFFVLVVSGRPKH